MNLQPKHSRGFSLIEMIVVVVIVALVMAFGLPAMSGWMRQTQIRTAAETLQAGIQRARTEAISRNGFVELVLTTDADTGPGQVDAVTQAATGANWLVRVRTVPCNAAVLPGATYVEGKTTRDTGARVISSVAQTASNAGVVAAATSVCFDSMGRAFAPLSVQFSDTPQTTPFATCATRGAAVINELSSVCVVISRGGGPRICLPGVDVATNPAAC